MSGGPAGPADPGLQPERTRLAWRRTALALTAVTVLTVRLAAGRGVPGAALAATAVAGWGVVLWTIWGRMTGSRRSAPGGGRAFPLTALATAGSALLGVLLVLVGVG
ncbi:DUF202 domain-containing protein [Micromonospora echinofusca]|uniref:DUF202 domain-containing protein n=1 Tax=Micromonospora echinofusca TaxID=47858 RepID=A0ABS3VKJ6_MICEH|nr:DUF202 domain-containing protein [Micromonospora echinofusca]MBO4204919.1 DUF202 domain-containing protein [Micromonospora echinofusca]